MRKAGLVEKIAAKTGLTQEQADAAVDAFVDSVVETLHEGKNVQLFGFGTFEVKTRPAHKYRNPVTGEKMDCPEKNVPNFRAAKSLKDQF